MRVGRLLGPRYVATSLRHVKTIIPQAVRRGSNVVVPARLTSSVPIGGQPTVHQFRKNSANRIGHSAKTYRVISTNPARPNISCKCVRPKRLRISLPLDKYLRLRRLYGVAKQGSGTFEIFNRNPKFSATTMAKALCCVSR